MAGVAWGAPTEFDYCGRLIPDDQIPRWFPAQVNSAYIQDDVYVEIPFLDAMRANGPAVSWTVLGDRFRDTYFPLWHANKAARDNLRAGVPAPDSGHYSRNEHCDDLDWQIEADFIGALAPGLVNPAIDMAWRAGHVMTFGDGAYGGVFVAAMHAAAFFAADVREIVEAGRAALPAGSKYRRTIDDVIAWHDAGRTFEATWQLLQDKWGNDDRCPSYQMWPMRSHNIDAKLNGAYVAMGLLFGDGDFEASMRLAMRCGQDSDCNPSTVGAVLGGWLGFSQIPDKFTSQLNSQLTFWTTNYTLDRAIKVSLDLARQVVVAAGGSIAGDGGEVWTLPPAEDVAPPIFEQWPEAANQPPELTAEIVDQNGLEVEFGAMAEDDDGIVAYVWHFGDLRHAAGATATHAYAAPGVYEATVFAADAVGNTAWRTLVVEAP
jgi:hypothetical protein